MRFAIYVGLAASSLWTVALCVGGPMTYANTVAAYQWFPVSLLSHVAFVAGLWRFGSVPASTGAARPARLAFLCLAWYWLVSLLCLLSFVWPPSPFLSDGSHATALKVVWMFALPVLVGACLALLVRALGAALRSTGETPPAWAPKATAAVVASWVVVYTLPFTLIIALPGATPSIGRYLSIDPLMWIWGIGMVGWGVFALALASVMGRTARALARQESPAAPSG